MIKLGAALGAQLHTATKLSLTPCLHAGAFRTTLAHQLNILPLLPSVIPTRESSFYKAGGSDELWKTMAGVSQQGKKRGRAKNTMQKKDLNRGQRLGYGKAKIAWPVLVHKASFVEKGKGEEVTKIEEMREDIYDHYKEALET